MQEWVGMMFHQGQCKGMHFESTNLQYMDKPESVIGKDILWTFKIQTDHPVSAGRPDLALQMSIEQISLFKQITVKTLKGSKMKITIYNMVTVISQLLSEQWECSQRVYVKMLEEIEIKNTGDHPRYSITRIARIVIEY